MSKHVSLVPLAPWCHLVFVVLQLAVVVQVFEFKRQTESRMLMELSQVEQVTLGRSQWRVEAAAHCDLMEGIGSDPGPCIGLRGGGPPHAPHSPSTFCISH